MDWSPSEQRLWYESSQAADNEYLSVNCEMQNPPKQCRQLKQEKYVNPVLTYYAVVHPNCTILTPTLKFDLLNKKLAHQLLWPRETFTPILPSPCLFSIRHVGQTDIQTDGWTDKHLMWLLGWLYIKACSYIRTVVYYTSWQTATEHTEIKLLKRQKQKN